MKAHSIFKRYGSFLLLLFFGATLLSHGIKIGGNLQMGDNIAEYALAKLLSLKYNIPYYHWKFRYADLFILDSQEQPLPEKQFNRVVRVTCEQDILDNLNSDEEVLFWTTIRTRIDSINPDLLENLRLSLRLKDAPEQEDVLPKDRITVAVHIRKGNGGGQSYDGEQASLQQFDFDRSRINYITDYFNYPFDWSEYGRDLKGNLIQIISIFNISDCPMDGAQYRTVLIDKIGDYTTKFPPDQFYIDQIIKLSNDLHDVPLYVQIFTDDKDPINLVERIKMAVNKSNILFTFYDNRVRSYREKMTEDLFIMSKTDILIRSQSNFSRVAEMMGKHKLVIYPLSSSWENGRLIMNNIVIKSCVRDFSGES